MTRKKLVFANWKMNLNSDSASQLVKDILLTINKDIDVEIVIAPPFPYLDLVSKLIEGTKIDLASQNIFHEENGPFTGEVSAQMVIDMGSRWVMIGHSERRQHLLETNSMINKKLIISASNNLNAILCVGETYDERRQDKIFPTISDQLKRGLSEIQKEDLSNIVIGYEPVWVIGSGKSAKPKDILEVHNFIHEMLVSLFPKAEELPRIVYGGSVNNENIESIISLENVDGVLVGNAGLDCKRFCDIVMKVGVSHD